MANGIFICRRIPLLLGTCFIAKESKTKLLWRTLFFSSPYTLLKLFDYLIVILSEAKDCTVKTTKGEWCHFPFTYKGVKYEECTRKDFFAKWCATNDKNHWGVCEGNKLHLHDLNCVQNLFAREWMCY